MTTHDWGDEDHCGTFMEWLHDKRTTQPTTRDTPEAALAMMLGRGDPDAPRGYRQEARDGYAYLVARGWTLVPAAPDHEAMQGWTNANAEIERLRTVLEGLIHLVEGTWSVPTPDCPHGDPACGTCEDQEGYRYATAYEQAVALAKPSVGASSR
jgi:hypothetical protein